METTLAPVTGVREIPLDLIDPSPGNPRHVINDAMVDPLSENMKLEGQKTPAKVRPKGDGRYEVLAGHLRRLAALKAGLTRLKCLVMDITPEQAFLEAVLDNRGQEMTWLDDYLVVERMKALFPGMRQEEMAARLEMGQATVSRALAVVKLLNPASRELIYSLWIKSTPYQVTVRVATALAGLATDSPDDPAKMEAALRVAVDRQMKEKDARKLAEWVKKGNKPEDFGAKEPKETPQDPYGAYWSILAPRIKVKMKAGGSYDIHMTVQGGPAAWNAAHAASQALQALAGQNPKPANLPKLEERREAIPTNPSQPASLPIGIAWNVLWAKIKHVPGARTLVRLFPRFAWFFNLIRGWIESLGVRNKAWANLITFILFLFVGSFLISQASRLLTRLAYHIIYSGMAVSQPLRVVAPNLRKFPQILRQTT